MVIDYRCLNMQTLTDKFPIPRIDDIMTELSTFLLFIILDGAHGFLQIDTNKHLKHKAAFVIPDGLFERLLWKNVVMNLVPEQRSKLVPSLLGDFWMSRFFISGNPIGRSTSKFSSIDKPSLYRLAFN